MFQKSGIDVKFEGYEITGPAPIEDILLARALLKEANQPCSNEIAAKAVGVLRLRTVAAQTSQDDLSLIVIQMARDLQQYPQDIVINVCREWGEQEKWFPSWSELKRICDKKFERRKAFEERLQRFPVERDDV